MGPGAVENTRQAEPKTPNRRADNLDSFTKQA